MFWIIFLESSIKIWVSGCAYWKTKIQQNQCAKFIVTQVHTTINSLWNAWLYTKRKILYFYCILHFKYIGEKMRSRASQRCVYNGSLALNGIHNFESFVSTITYVLHTCFEACLNQTIACAKIYCLNWTCV